MNASVSLCKRWGGLLLLVGLVACSGLISKPEPPRVTLVGLQLISVELLEQRYQVSLRVKNPNAFVLPVRGIDFRLDINGRAFADGVSGQSVDVPAYGEKVIDVEVSSNLLQVFSQLQSLRENQPSSLEYRISGSMATGIAGQSLPFDYDGELRLSVPRQSGGQNGV